MRRQCLCYCRYMWTLLLWIIAFFRFIVPLFIFSHPIGATLASLALDGIDGYIAFRAGWKHPIYNRYDKLADYWWYVCILLYCAHLPIYPMVLILFLYRSVAQLISIVSGNHAIFLWFPNLLEPFFIGYILTYIFPDLSVWFEGSHQIVPLIISLVTSVPREYIIHIKQISVAHYLFHLDFDWKKNEPRGR
jgi:phosphatidylglycerophosphate synthase